MTAKLLGPADEPDDSGAVVAVHLGDYRSQEIWVRSGANIGNWYPLGGEFGRPWVAVDQRTAMQKLTDNPPFRVQPGEVPQHPVWSDVLARGPVTLLTAGETATYAEGWKNGRRALWDSMEQELYDEPPEASR